MSNNGPLASYQVESYQEYIDRPIYIQGKSSTVKCPTKKGGGKWNNMNLVAHYSTVVYNIVLQRTALLVRSQAIHVYNNSQLKLT